MNRRSFVCGLASAGAVVAGAGRAMAFGSDPGTGAGFAIDGNRVRIRSPRIRSATRLMIVGDTHLFRDDARGESYRQYSGRMAKAYNQTRHWRTGEATDPERCFAETLRMAKEAGIDRLVLAGDIVSFPSEAAVDWVRSRLEECGLPHCYTAGNHDWHYEGMEGSLEELRSTWIQRRLLPLYGGEDPLMQALDVGGIRLVLLDNSHYEITPAQLRFLRAQLRGRRPVVLVVHIPLYAPGRSVGFGCGHPDWGAATDKGYELERRQRWRVGGHTKTTLAFHREVFTARNLLGVFAGHIHKPSVDVINGIPQVVTEANATGGYLEVELLPP